MLQVVVLASYAVYFVKPNLQKLLTQKDSKGRPALTRTHVQVGGSE